MIVSTLGFPRARLITIPLASFLISQRFNRINITWRLNLAYLTMKIQFIDKANGAKGMTKGKLTIGIVLRENKSLLMVDGLRRAYCEIWGK